ncbi:Hypothetical protein PHPALM_15963 [Phytophthora palmivora]|uniref:Uncharacterized protein n=1 Tax=Phytophthora palmivora TaxID=4796 RepID=A0A2P4XR12_9STRA|nr:Hypothetical protein PHPALM_15963 [Phytophthora palmivora]
MAVSAHQSDNTGDNQQQEARQVHEITDSSDDDTPATSNSEQDSTTAEDEEKTDVPPELVEKMRAGVYMPDPDVVYNTKNVADMHYLFTNDKLKDESPAIVLRSDPFCIPRGKINCCLGTFDSIRRNDCQMWGNKIEMDREDGSLLHPEARHQLRATGST